MIGPLCPALATGGVKPSSSSHEDSSATKGTGPNCLNGAGIVRLASSRCQEKSADDEDVAFVARRGVGLRGETRGGGGERGGLARGWGAVWGGRGGGPGDMGGSGRPVARTGQARRAREAAASSRASSR